MNIASLLSGGVDKVVDSVAKGLDELFTSDQEKLILANKLEEIKNDAKAKAMEDATEFEKEITKRWLSDNEHIITRLVRPLSFVFVLFLFGVIVLADGNVGSFIVDSDYVPLIQNLLMTMTVAYFGARSFDKHSKNKHSKGG